MKIHISQFIKNDLTIYNKIEILDAEDFDHKDILTKSGKIVLNNKTFEAILDYKYGFFSNTIKEGKSKIDDIIQRIEDKLNTWRAKKKDLEEQELYDENIEI